MWLLENWSIKRKLILLSTVSGALALGLACTALVVNDFFMMRNAKVRQLQSMAQILGYNSSVGLLSMDQAACDAFLRSLAKQPDIKRVCLYAVDGTPFSVYPESEAAQFSPSWIGQSPVYQFNNRGTLEVFHPIYERGNYIGGVSMQADTTDVAAQFDRNLMIAGKVMLLSIVASFLFSCWMQRWLSAPILTLAEAAGRIERESDYSIRVQATTRDEISILYDSFNRMVEQIQSSNMRLEQANVELEQAHTFLEQRVSDRTRELQEEIYNRARIQNELERAKDSAEAANRAKSEFLANMSHEIRTPLNAILGVASLMQDGSESQSERLEFLNTIQNGGQHLVTLVNDFLDLSKIEAGQMEFDRVTISPHQIIAEMISVLRVRAQEKGLSLEYHWAGPIPETIVTDPGRMRQLLINLIGNAIKFTEHGGIQVAARLETIQEQLFIEVIDTGIGIPAAKLSSIFEPFTQADSSVTRRFGGTGLGLSICRHISRALGGEVKVESEPGIGSTFTLSVATGSLQGICLLDELESGVPHRNRKLSPRKRTRLPNTRILVVDDGETNRKLIKLILNRAEVSVQTAENGQEAVDLALSQRFDLILMDMQMPIVDGYTATRRLRQAGLTIPVIALTAHALREDEQKCLEAGCSSYLTKPIDSERLTSVLAVALKRGRESLVNMTTNQVPIQTDVLESTLPLDDQEFLDIIHEFAARLKVRLAEMRDAYLSRDMRRLSELAHWLKGTGGTAGFTPLSTSAAELEAAIKSENDNATELALIELEQLANRVSVPDTVITV